MRFMLIISLDTISPGGAKHVCRWQTHYTKAPEERNNRPFRATTILEFRAWIFIDDEIFTRSHSAPFISLLRSLKFLWTHYSNVLGPSGAGWGQIVTHISSLE